MDILPLLPNLNRDISERETLENDLEVLYIQSLTISLGTPCHGAFSSCCQNPQTAIVHSGTEGKQMTKPLFTQESCP